VREPLILLGGGAEVRSYSSQAGRSADAVRALLQLVRIEGRPKQAGARVTLFFFANMVAFAWAVAANVEHIGVYFYIWVGIFSLSIIAQFWSYANDTYSKEAGDRLFPIIAIGSTLGSPLGAWITATMFHAGFAPHLMMCISRPCCCS
jgi:AAA family ATP:ADP antiporter